MLNITHRIIIKIKGLLSKYLLRRLGKYLFYPINNKLVMNKFSENDKHVFFGYYDITPFNRGNSRLLACQIPIKNGNYTNAEVMKVGWYDLDVSKSKFNVIGETITWCWQQSCRLRWYPGSNYKYVIHNTVVENKYGSVIMDINSKDVINYFNYPLYDLNHNGRLGVSLNFSRLQRLRPGYGYSKFTDETYDQLAPVNDGIYLINLKNNSQELIITLNEITKIKPTEDMIGAEHYFNHLSFNPDSSTFMFFHLWKNRDKRFSRLFTYNIPLSETKLISENIVSHYSWKSNSELLVTEFIDNNVMYNLCNVETGNKETIGNNLLIYDGHPSFSKKKNFLITDTYPSRFGLQKLMMFRLDERDALITLNRFYSPIKFVGEYKCDLHPRLSDDDKLLCIDTAPIEKREIVIIKLDDF